MANEMLRSAAAEESLVDFHRSTDCEIGSKVAGLTDRVRGEGLPLGWYLPVNRKSRGITTASARNRWSILFGIDTRSTWHFR
jgi:hypothetical protein